MKKFLLKCWKIPPFTDELGSDCLYHLASILIYACLYVCLCICVDIYLFVYIVCARVYIMCVYMWNMHICEICIFLLTYIFIHIFKNNFGDFLDIHSFKKKQHFLFILQVILYICVCNCFIFFTFPKSTKNVFSWNLKKKKNPSDFITFDHLISGFTFLFIYCL